ncbi:hypothetical protein [Streptomyces sp. NPDC093707]|uniref:hypothetical protein n=1 Tax=Streptomyces sp. NPDC093707 TaxID=3154984 RepID=UPI00344DF101
MYSSQEHFWTRSSRAIRELSESNSFRVEFQRPDPSIVVPTDQSEVLATLMRHVTFPVAESLREYHFPAEAIHASWESSGQRDARGEMRLASISTCLTQWHPPLGDMTLGESGQAILAELKIMDEEPFAGTGRATGLRITGRNMEPEVWYHDRPRSRLTRLELTYGAYAETALITKGAFCWQYLFANVELSHPEFHGSVENLRESFTLFSETFPQYDYVPLLDRLEARL